MASVSSCCFSSSCSQVAAITFTALSVTAALVAGVAAASLFFPVIGALLFGSFFTATLAWAITGVAGVLCVLSVALSVYLFCCSSRAYPELQAAIRYFRNSFSTLSDLKSKNITHTHENIEGLYSSLQISKTGHGGYNLLYQFANEGTYANILVSCVSNAGSPLEIVSVKVGKQGENEMTEDASLKNTLKRLIQAATQNSSNWINVLSGPTPTEELLAQPINASNPLPILAI